MCLIIFIAETLYFTVHHVIKQFCAVINICQTSEGCIYVGRPSKFIFINVLHYISDLGTNVTFSLQ